MRRLFGGLAIAALLAGAAACESNQTAGNANATNAPAAPATPPVPPGTASTLTPGTPEYILANQPDATGDIKAAAGLVNFNAKFWRKGGNARLEGDAGQLLANLQGKGRIVVLARPNQPTLVVNVDQKRYYEAPVGSTENPADYIAFYVKNWREKGWTVQEAGEDTVDGHPTTKYRIAPPGGSAAAAVQNANAPASANANAAGAANTNAGGPVGNDEVFAYVAKDMNNLILRLDGRLQNQPFRIDITNPSTTVQDTAFDPPAGFPAGFTKVADMRGLIDPNAPGTGAAPAANTNGH
jgi:hypothetical protein